MLSSIRLCALHIHRSTLLAIILGMGATACEIEGQELLAEDDLQIDTDAAGLHADLALEDAVEPQAAGSYPTWQVLAPFRLDDLKPNHYPTIFANADKWHDIVINRYDGGWTGQRPGLTGETNSLGWGVPVYAGVDGEVMSCWRTAPYDAAYVDVQHKLAIGGNFITIKTSDGKWLYYAHLDTNSIPAELCPNVSTNGGYLQVCDKPNEPWDCEVCDDNGGKQCSLVETYIPAGSRPQVHAGQFIGRTGAIGNAAMAHLHMGAGTINTVGGIDRMVQTDLHITFEHSWHAPGPGESPPIAWTASSGMSLPNAVTTDHTLMWFGGKREETYSGTYRLAKYGGGVGTDLLCHDTDSGNLYTDGDDSPVKFGGTNWSRTANFCKGDSQRLLTGDFDGDTRSDLLCHDLETGIIQIDYGAFNTVSGNTEFNGVNFTSVNGWCNGDTQQLIVGNFDDDTKDDLLCHDHADGRRWLDRANDGFAGTNHSFGTGWCFGHFERLHVGRFDTTSAGDDLLCHNTSTGAIQIDATPSNAQIALGTPIFGATDQTTGPWCYARGQRLFAGDFLTGSWLDELVCHDSDTGKTFINVPTSNASYPGTSSVGAVSGFCTGPYERLKVGDIDGDNADDLLCFDRVTGERSIDYAAWENSVGGVFGGVDWTSTGAWCHDPDQSLH